MLSTQTRLRVEFLCARIEAGENIEFNDMVWLEKWAHNNRSVHDMVNRARRRAINGVPLSGSMDEFLDHLNLGNVDPETHLTGDSNIDDIVDFFRAPGWTQRD